MNEHDQEDAPVYLTAEGLQKIKEELRELQTVRRPELLEEISFAREGGDVSENSALDGMQHELRITDAKIFELESKISRAHELTTQTGGQVQLGSTVLLLRKTTGSTASQEVTYRIVDPVEAKPGEGRISYQSPVGKALLGKRKGDKVDVTTPGGIQHYTIKKIS